jgi:flagellar motility protein MotE (MotC chaperone)
VEGSDAAAKTQTRTEDAGNREAHACGDGDRRRRAWAEAISIGESVAETVSAPPADAAAAASTTPAPANGATAATAAPAANQCAAPTIADLAGLSADEVQVLEALRARREQLDARGEQIETQDGLMQAAEQRLSQRLAELHQLEATVNDLLGHLDEAQEQRITGLVDVYQRMRAKDAANVFNELDDGVLIQVAGRMRQANLAEVMGRMQPDRARHLTQLLADRARPPTGGAALLANATGSGSPASTTSTPAPAAANRSGG